MVEERCRNPFKRKKKCTNTNIVVSIKYKGEILAVCEKCWIKIAKSDREWSS